MLETEKSNLLGLIGHSVGDLGELQVVQSPLERMQRFLFGLHESCYHMIGSMGPSLGRDLYTLPDIGLAIINSVLACLQVRWVGFLYLNVLIFFFIF
jgi:exportin-5